MVNDSDIQKLQQCLLLAETRLNRGASAGWTSYDFEKLSEAITGSTGVTLSVTTLKRLWGKVKYDNLPAITTLNTLAQFVGFADWRQFELSSALAAEARPNTSQPVPAELPRAAPVKTKSRWSYTWLGLLLLPVLVYLGIFSKTHQEVPVAVLPGAYSFSSNTVVTSGVPNSVVFTYNAAAAPTDSVFISQSWDVSRKAAVAKNNHQYSSIYYYPGYFRAKLLVGNQVVKEHDLFINSGGWTAMLNTDPVPLYFKKQEYQKDNHQEIDAATLQAYQVALQPKPPMLELVNVQDLGMQDDHFVFETSLKNDFKQGTAACQQVEVLLLCKNDVFMIPLCAKGCVGNIQLYAAGAGASSSNADLSGFGCDLSNWVNLRVEVANGQADFYVNGHKAYSSKLTHPPSDLVGVECRFTGTGAVRNTRFTNGQKTINL